MCVIFFALNRHPDYRLLLIANRDEFFDRPTLNLHRWEDFPHIRAGRDLVGGGTWLGVTDSGRFAAVTNYRDPNAPTGIESRGRLVADFLENEVPVGEYVNSIHDNAEKYSGFNLLVGEINSELNEVFYFSNRGNGIQKLESGVYGLSNALLDTPWPKIKRGKEQFTELMNHPESSIEDVFEVLGDKTLAPDDELPNTGIGYDREKLLSAIFIETPVYGTRSSSVLSINKAFEIRIEEKVIR